MVDMFLPDLGKDEDVDQIDEHILIQQVPKKIIYESLEDDQGIGQTKGNDLILVMFSGYIESRLPLVPCQI